MIRIERYDDVIRVKLTSPGSVAARMSVSAYLVRETLIDTGFPRAASAIARLLGEQRVRGAILTHWHEDHAGNAELLAARGVPLAMHAETEAQLRALPSIRLYRRVVWGRPRELRAAVERYEHPSLALIATPGHSADHHIVWDAERETIFSGDLWLGVRSRIMHSHEDPHRIVRSLRTAAALRPRRMFDAHRGPVANATAALTARAEWMEDTISAIETKLAAGWSDRAITRAVLGGEELTAFASGGEYARTNFVRAVRRARASAAGG